MHFCDAKGILSARNGMNIYRGCQHGCIYCDSRSKCYNFTHDFEDIEVKRNAPALLSDALSRKRAPVMVGTGAMCDPYMQIEAELKLTLRCLEIIYERGCGVALQTKSDLVLRDIELLAAINERAKCVVQMTLTTYDERLCSIIEPNVCTTKKRYEALLTLRERGIPTVVWLSPILPFINDTEENLRGILGYCFDAGVKGIICFGIGTTMREGDREYFYAALDRSFPGVKRKYIDRFGGAYECVSDNSDALMKIFRDECDAHNVLHDNGEIFTYLSRLPRCEAEQMTLF